MSLISYVLRGENMQKNVLLVDDSPSCLTMLEGLIKSEFDEVVSITSCLSAIEAQEKLAQRYFHLVVTDIVMPDMDGYELIQYIKENYNVPIVAISAGFSQFGPNTSLRAATVLGAHAVVPKHNIEYELVPTIKPFIV
ncbi:response regulator [Vibrio sp. S4M6]|uniref:response regulator n=1 Tax=Vibrio sinus TaxID=2946865 RepID=UPI002029F4C1|nr:response regulator [Vibrio sinus]MCL9783876.1 response regulator [Vibrio sinus]